MGEYDHIPPRNGEGDHAAQRRGGGVFSARENARAVAKRERRSGNLPEVILWRELRQRPGGYKFRQQHPIGNCVLDFACLGSRLAIEVDGEVDDRGDQPRKDEVRDEVLQAKGFTVLRISAREVLGDLSTVIMAIVAACDEQKPLHRSASGPPPHSGEVLDSRS